MSIIVKSHHVEITSALKEYAKKKVEKLKETFDTVISIDISLSIEASSAESDRQVSSAVIHANTGIITAKETSQDMYSSIDLLYEKLRRQLRKAKEKQKNHKGHSPADGRDLSIKTGSPSSNGAKIEKQRYIPKPMGDEDASEILKEEELNFLVYRDLKETICVIYRNEDGSLAIIRT